MFLNENFTKKNENYELCGYMNETAEKCGYIKQNGRK